ncbi:MAG: zeta toxin family protein [Candidatus Protochlamydia sp.]|nr:zeta toxin family protein [Candidatus Protochlamydia sp.]
MSNFIACNPCNLDLIYNSVYKYSLPKNVLEGFLSGKAFDNKENYTEEESENLSKDINELYQQIISTNPAKEKKAIITAGAPGAGKTVNLRQDLETNALHGKHYAYICPDDVCLQSQTRTYRADLEKNNNSMEARQNAYNKWRPGSNAATHLILGNIIRENYAFYFGSTSSGPATGKFFEFLKAQGYRIKLIHVSAPDEVRWGSIQERDKTFVQTTEQDVREKGLLLPQRINDTFLKYADEIEFYYRDGVKQDAILAAKWLRNEESQEYLGTLEIVAPEQYQRIKTIHNEAAKILTRPDLYWESTVEKSSQVL